VLTNEPGYPDQLENFKKYADLTNKGEKGLIGMPGEMSSKSRFSRLTLLRKFAEQKIGIDNHTNRMIFWAKVYGATWSVQQAFHLLNHATAFHGEMRHAVGGVEVYPRTVLTLVRDHLNKTIYFKTGVDAVIDNVTIRSTGSSDAECVSIDAGEDSFDAGIDTAEALPSALAQDERNNRFSLKVTIPVPAALVNKKGNFYVFARMADGGVLCWNGRKWAQSKSPLIPCATGKLKSKTFSVIKKDDPAKWEGAAFYAGCGLGEADMLGGNRFALVYQADSSLIPGLTTPVAP
jgi:hypothetical protein